MFNPKKQGGSLKCVTLADNSIDWDGGKYPDSTLLEYCEYWLDSHKEAVNDDVSRTQKQKLTRKKKTIRSSQAATDRVQILRSEYWGEWKHRPEQPRFLDEMGVRLVNTNPCTFKNGSSLRFKTLYGSKVTVVGLAWQSSRINDPKWVHEWQGFKVFIEHFCQLMGWCSRCYG